MIHPLSRRSIPARHAGKAAFAAAFFALTTSASLHAQTAPAIKPAISVTGEGVVHVEPDMAEIDGGVTVEAKSAGEASSANAKAMGAVLAALRSKGINEKDMRTTRLSLSPLWPSVKTGTPQISGYRASNRVHVKIRDLAQAPIILDALVESGANEVGGISFTMSEPGKHLDRARAEAMADARRKAEIYAKAAGVTLGAPLMIAEEGANIPQPVMMRAMAPAAAPSPIAPGEQALRVIVSVTWEIKGETKSEIKGP